MPDLAFLKDKKFQLAAGGGAVLALVVLVRKKQGGGGSTSSTTGTAGALGTYNDQGMDAYQNLNNELNAGIQAYAGQLTSIQDQLLKLEHPPAAPKPKPKPKPTPKPKGKLDAHQLHVQHVKNTTPKKKATPTAHQLHVEHVKNKGPAPRKRR